MRAVNHALTGALIGLTVSEPLLALPAALVSHYILDAIPHHGSRDDSWLKTKSFRYSLYIDALLCSLFVAALIIIEPARWFQAVVCAFIAAAPDLLSFNRYLHIVRRKAWRPSAYAKFAHDIQWFERPIGAVVEVVWFGASLVLLLSFLY